MESVAELAFISRLCQSVFNKASGLYTTICCFCRLIKLTCNQKVGFQNNYPQGKFSPWIFSTLMIAAPGIAHKENCPPPPSPPKNMPPHHKISSENSCLQSSKFPSSSTMTELKKAMHCLRVLQSKNHSTKSIFKAANQD